VLVCIAGDGQVEHDGTDYAVGKGDVLLLPAVVGACYADRVVPSACWRFHCRKTPDP